MVTRTCAILLLASSACGWGLPQIPCQNDGQCPTGYVCNAPSGQSGQCVVGGGPQMELLTVNVASGGTVSSSPAGISCPVNCIASFATNTQVTLSAAPASGHQFNGWSGACSGSGACTVEMTSAQTVTGTFISTPMDTLEIQIAGNGTITIAPNTTCTGTGCTEQYPDGTQLTLTATPAAGSVFSGFSGACNGSTCVLTLHSDQTVIATFQNAAEPTMSLVLEGLGSGTITSLPSGIDCVSNAGLSSGSCNASFTSGAQVTLNAVPGNGSTFTGWGGDCSGTAACATTLDSNTDITATFGIASSSNSISVMVTGTGTVTSSPAGINCTASGGTCTSSFADGSSVTLTASGSGGESFSSWSGCPSSMANSCTIVLTNANFSVDASFSATSVNVNFSIAAEASPSAGIQYEVIDLLMPGESMTIPIVLTLVGGTTGPVALTATGLPTGVTAQFSPASVTPPGTSTLTLSVLASAPITASNATISVTGTAGSDTQSAYVYFNVRSPALVGPVALAIETGGATALVSDSERLVRVDTTTRLATKTIASAFLQPRQLELEAGGASVLLVEQGTGSLLRVELSSGAVTVPVTGLAAPYGLAIEEGGGTALISYTGSSASCTATGGVVRANLSSGVVTSMATGIKFPRGIAIEAGGSTALVAEAGTTYSGGCGPTNANIDRIDLTNHSVAILGGSPSFYPDAIVLEPGGATALLTHNGSLLRFGVATGTFTPLLVQQQEQAAYPSGLFDLAIESSGTTALMVDGALNVLRRTNIQGQLTPIAPTANSPTTFIATSGSHGAAMETATTLLVTDCSTVNCAATANPSDRLLRVHTDTGEVEVVANTLVSPGGVAVEDGGTTALVIQNQYTGSGNLVRVTLSGSDAGTVSAPLVTGIAYPQAVAIEPGGTTVLLSNGNVGIVRGNLVNNTLVTVAQSPGAISAIAIEGGSNPHAYFVPTYTAGALYGIDRTLTNQTPTLVANLLANTTAMQLDASGATALVGLTGGEIDRVNVSTGATTIVSSLSRTAQALALDPSGSFLAVGDSGDGISAAVTQVGLGNPNIPSVLTGGFELPGAIAIESSGTTALMLDCDPSTGDHVCTSSGRLVRIDLGTGAFTVLKTGYNFANPSPLAIAPDGNSVLIADCGAAGSVASCNGASRLLSVPLDGNVTDQGTVILTNLDLVGGISFEASNQALISEPGSGSLVRAFITTKGSITLAIGLQTPSTVAVEAGDATALVAAGNSLVRVDLADGGTTAIVPLDQSTFVVEPGGATAVLASFTNLYRANLATGAIDTLNSTPGYLPEYSQEGYAGLLGLAVTPDGGTLVITESSGYSSNGRVIVMPDPL